MTLDQLPNDTLAIITNSFNHRLEELCFTEGERVKIISRATFGGPLAVKVGTSVFALRIEEAKLIEVNIL